MRGADPKETAILFWEGAETFKRFRDFQGFFDADMVINLPKLKTHGLTYLTGAVKNFFGLVYGLNKSQWHFRARSGEEFSSLLLDLYGALLQGSERPRRFIHMMDAITGLEGEGPGISGVPKSIGAMLLGQDALAVDAVAVRLVNLDRKRVHTLMLGQQRELGAATLENIQILGGRLEALEVRDYVPSSAVGDPSAVSRWPLNTEFFKNLFVEKPVPSQDRCTLCYQCKAICPGGAIEKSDGWNPVPLYNYDKCIRCYCCMEICPEAAITLKRGKLQWLLSGRAK
jgi:Pyruvate/2-oxoacid:ferredoxin oxidoreductase delta subunit